MTPTPPYMDNSEENEIQSATDLFSNYRIVPRTGGNERGDLMKIFCKRINKEREGTTYQPISMARMGYLLQGIDTYDLYALEKKPDDFKGTWSQWFFYRLK